MFCATDIKFASLVIAATLVAKNTSILVQKSDNKRHVSDKDNRIRTHPTYATSKRLPLELIRLNELVTQDWRHFNRPSVTRKNEVRLNVTPLTVVFSFEVKLFFCFVIVVATTALTLVAVVVVI